MLFGVLVAVASLIWTISLYVRHKRKKILVSFSLDNGFTYKDSKDSDEIHIVPHRVVVDVKNNSTHGCFVDLPMVSLSKKVRGERLWVPYGGGKEEITTELKPGEVQKKQYNLDQFLKGDMSKLKGRHYLRFIVEDSIGNRYKSKKLRLKALRNFSKRELERCY